VLSGHKLTGLKQKKKKKKKKKKKMMMMMMMMKSKPLHVQWMGRIIRNKKYNFIRILLN
jgi:hypothetical protein